MDRLDCTVAGQLQVLWQVSRSALILIQALLLYSQRIEVAPARSCWQGGKKDQ